MKGLGRLDSNVRQDASLSRGAHGPRKGWESAEREQHESFPGPSHSLATMWGLSGPAPGLMRGFRPQLRLAGPELSPWFSKQ